MPSFLRLEHAEANFDHVLSRTPNDINALVSRGEILLLTGDEPAAYDDLTRAVELMSMSARGNNAQLVRARTLMRRINPFRVMGY